MLAVITGGQGSLATALHAVLTEQGWEVLAPSRVELDVTQAAAVTEWFRHHSQPVDLLINAAGLVRDAPTATLAETAWDDVVATNLKGAFLCCQAVASRMLAAGEGHMIQIGSFSGLWGRAGQANYAAAKAGLIGLTKSLAAEWGSQGIRVNAVLPGWLEPSRMTQEAPASARALALSQHVLGKFNTPQAAAQFIAFLHKMEAVSGQVFQLDSRGMG